MTAIGSNRFTAFIDDTSLYGADLDQPTSMSTRKNSPIASQPAKRQRNEVSPTLSTPPHQQTTTSQPSNHHYKLQPHQPTRTPANTSSTPDSDLIILELQDTDFTNPLTFEAEFKRIFSQIRLKCVKPLFRKPGYKLFFFSSQDAKVALSKTLPTNAFGGGCKLWSPSLRPSTSTKPSTNKQTTSLSCVIKNVPISVDIQQLTSHLQAQDTTITNCLRITSRATGQPTTLVRLFTDSADSLTKFLTVGIRIGHQIFHCEESRTDFHPQAAVVQCFKCQSFGHMSRDCPAPCPVCRKCGLAGHSASGCRADKVCCPNCSGPHPASYRGCPVFREAQAAQVLPIGTPASKVSAAGASQVTAGAKTYASAAAAPCTNSDICKFVVQIVTGLHVNVLSTKQHAANFISTVIKAASSHFRIQLSTPVVQSWVTKSLPANKASKNNGQRK